MGRICVRLRLASRCARYQPRQPREVHNPEYLGMKHESHDSLVSPQSSDFSRTAASRSSLHLTYLLIGIIVDINALIGRINNAIHPVHTVASHHIHKINTILSGI